MSGAETLFVIVDMVNEFCQPAGKRYIGSGVTEQVIDRIESLLLKARSRSVKVIHVRPERKPTAPEFTVFGREPILLENTWATEFVEQLRPMAGEPILQKETHDCFYRTEMDSLLEKMEIKPLKHHVIVTGAVSNVCVYHAILGFHIRHYWVVVPLDCVLGTPEASRFLESQLSANAYNYNCILTRSDQIQFRD